MELITVRFTISFLAEIGGIIPFIIAMYAWPALNTFQKYYLMYLAACITISIYSFWLYNQGRSTHFLSTYQSIADCAFLFQLAWLFKSGQLKKLILVSGLISLIFILWSVLSHTGAKIGNSSLSSLSIDFFISFYSAIYLAGILKLADRHMVNALDVVLALQLMMTFFIEAVFGFFKQYLFETQVNFYVYMQIENLVNIFNIIWIGIIAWAFYQIRNSPNWNTNE